MASEDQVQEIISQIEQTQLNQEDQEESQDVVEDLLFGNIEFESKEFKIERLSHSQKKLQQYMNHLEKHKEKDFLKNKWKDRRDRVNKRLDGMTNEEKFEERSKRKEEIQKEKENQQKGFESGIPLIIDNSYEQFMTLREIRSLAIQIYQTTLAQRKNKNPFQINVCNASQQLKDCMVGQQYKTNPFYVYEEDILQVEKFKGKEANMIYLSPDSENELETVDPSGNTIYIVGGLIDRTVKKWASFDRANSLKVKSAKLPINQYLTDLTRRALNIDTVTIMMGLAIEINFDWKTTTLTVLGNRKIKEDLKEEQKQIVFEASEKLNNCILDKSSHINDVKKSIEYRENKKKKMINQNNLQQQDSQKSSSNLEDSEQEQQENGNNNITIVEQTKKEN